MVKRLQVSSGAHEESWNLDCSVPPSIMSHLCSWAKGDGAAHGVATKKKKKLHLALVAAIMLAEKRECQLTHHPWYNTSIPWIGKVGLSC